MKPKRFLLSILLVVAGHSIVFSQYSSAEAVKVLRILSEDLAKTVQKGNEPFEWYVGSTADSARKIAIDLQKGLKLTSTIRTESPSPAEIPADTRKNIVRSLAKLVADLQRLTIPESPDGIEEKHATKLLLQLNAIIHFTDPDQFESRKSYPLSVGDLLRAFAQTNPPHTPDAMDEQALNLVRKRCVDFVLSETITWAIKMAGASEALVKEVDACLSPSQRAIITDSDAAKPISDKMRYDAALIGDLFRTLFSKKEIENRKRAVEVGREFLRRFEHYEDARELTDYLRNRLPKMEAQIRKVDPPRVRP